MKHLPFALFVILQFVTQYPTQPGAVATGEIRLANGNPASGIDVFFIPVPGGGGPGGPRLNTAVTDASGRYRVGTLIPGTYFISAARTNTEFPTYYPGEPAFATARTITAELGKPVTADFTLLKPSGVRVSGVLMGMPAAPTEDAVQVMLRRNGISGSYPKVPVKQDGSFEFANVPAGEYLFRVNPNPPCGGSVGAPIQVANTDIRDIVITSSPVIAGKMVVEDGAGLPTTVDGKNVLAGVGVIANVSGCLRSDETPLSTTVQANGLFVGSLGAGEYKIVPNVPLGYTVKSIAAGGVDLLQQPFNVSKGTPSPEIRIVLIPPSSVVTLSGHLTGIPAGQTNGATAVLLTRFPERGPNSESVEVPIRSDGTFEYHAVPPGNYRMRALPDTMIPQSDLGPLPGYLSLTVGTQDILGIDLPRSIP